MRYKDFLLKFHVAENNILLLLWTEIRFILHEKVKISWFFRESEKRGNRKIRVNWKIKQFLFLKINILERFFKNFFHIFRVEMVCISQTIH